MNLRLNILLLLAVLLIKSGMSQDVRTAPAATIARLPELTLRQDRAQQPARPPAAKPDFQIQSTQVKLVDVVEAPPMAGLPPVEGTIQLKVHSVADPGLPEPARSVASQPEQADFSDNPEFLERLAQLAEEQQQNRFAFVSATVYDRSRTRLTCHPSGDGHTAVTAWSNIDFNHFRSIGRFEVSDADDKTRSYQLMLGIGNQDSRQQRAWRAARQTELNMPQMPALPTGAPAFVIVTENPDPASVQLLEDMHALYRDEGTRMAADVAASEKANQQKKAYLRANPPQPKDVTVHFWKR